MGGVHAWQTGSVIGFIDDKKGSIFIETAEGAKVLLDDNEKLVNLAQEACARLEKYMPLQPSSAFFLNYYFFKLHPSFLIGHWEEVVSISVQAGALLGQSEVLRKQNYLDGNERKKSN